MKKLLMAAATSMTLLMGGCNSVDLAQVQQATVAACGFLPTAIQVAQWAQIQSPYYVTATQIAQVICNAVTAPRITRYRMQGEITRTVRLPDGTTATVTGHFVR